MSEENLVEGEGDSAKVEKTEPSVGSKNQVLELLWAEAPLFVLAAVSVLLASTIGNI